MSVKKLQKNFQMRQVGNTSITAISMTMWEKKYFAGLTKTKTQVTYKLVLEDIFKSKHNLKHK